MRLLLVKLLLMISLVSGCGVTQESRMEREAEYKVAFTEFENQLVSDKNTAYGELTAAAFGAVVAVDQSENLLRPITSRYMFGGYNPGASAQQYHWLKLKVPVGMHKISVRHAVVSGSTGVGLGKITSFDNVLIEAGKKYKVYSKMDSNEDKIAFIAEYETDNRFSPKEKDYYVLKKVVSKYVYLGSNQVSDYVK